MPNREDCSGSALEAMTAEVPEQAATTSPIRDAIASSITPGGPNQPSLTASSRDATQACSPSTSRQVARTSAAAPGAVYTCRARGSPPSSATPSRSTAAGPSASTSILSSGPTLTMPWSAVTYSAVPDGRAEASCSTSRFTCESWNSQAWEDTPYTCPVESRSPW